MDADMAGMALVTRPPRRARIAAATINMKRAGVDCNVALHITSNGPLTVNLAGCKRTVQVSG